MTRRSSRRLDSFEPPGTRVGWRVSRFGGNREQEADQRGGHKWQERNPPDDIARPVITRRVVVTLFGGVGETDIVSIGSDHHAPFLCSARIPGTFVPREAGAAPGLFEYDPPPEVHRLLP
jgi:hypothetical protein